MQMKFPFFWRSDELCKGPCKVKLAAAETGCYPNDLEYLKCRRCDGRGRYAVANMPRECKDYPNGPVSADSLTASA